MTPAAAVAAAEGSACKGGWSLTPMRRRKTQLSRENSTQTEQQDFSRESGAAAALASVLPHVDRATLRCCGIRGLGDVSAEADAAHLARLAVLDVQCNLLNSWADVAKICASAHATRWRS